jgi:quercetin dioxygenase-like cupin family protein
LNGALRLVIANPEKWYSKNHTKWPYQTVPLIASFGGMQKQFQIPVLILALLAPAALVAGQAASPAVSSPPGARVRPVFSQALPQLDGTRLQVTTVEVTYPPGGSSAPHSHPCPVIGYVLKGAVRMQVKGGALSIYKAGDSFYEAPNGIHLVSQNASAKEPATFLAYFICDHSTPLSVKVPAVSSKEEGQP